MDDVIDRLTALSLDHDINLKRRIQGYFLRLQNSNDYFLVKRRKICLKDIPGKSYILLERKLSNTGELVIVCPLCMSGKAIENVSNLNEDDIETIKKKSCEHVLVCKLLWDNKDLCEIKMEEYDEGIDVVEFLKNETEYVAIVHPSNKNKKKVSAPLRLSNRKVSPKCCLCKGADLCVHLRIHKIHFDSQEKRIQENNSYYDHSSLY